MVEPVHGEVEIQLSAKAVDLAQRAAGPKA
jgi:hypothetical protein